MGSEPYTETKERERESEREGGKIFEILYLINLLERVPVCSLADAPW